MPRRVIVALLAIVPAFFTSGRGTAADQNADVPVIRSARSGAWSDIATWEQGHVPAGGAKGQVRQGHVVTYDALAPASLGIRSLPIGGTVTFAADKPTQLNVGLIKIEDSESTDEEGFDCDDHADEPSPDRPRPALLVGTPEHPVAAGTRALIRLNYVAGMKKESCPA